MKAVIILCGKVGPNIEYTNLGQLPKIFKNADLVSIDLDGPITENNLAWPLKANIQKFRPKEIGWIKQLNVKHATLANYHIMDYRQRGIIDTIKYLNSLGIQFTGAGINKENASNTHIYKFDTQWIGIISCTVECREWKAGEVNSGIFNITSSREIIEKIATIKPLCKLIILHFHYKTLTDKIKDIMHEVIHAGVDIIQGYTDKIGPIEVVQRYTTDQNGQLIRSTPGIILYSLGNLLSDETCIASITINFETLNRNIELVPVHVVDKKIKLIANSDLKYQKIINSFKGPVPSFKGPVPSLPHNNHEVDQTSS